MDQHPQQPQQPLDGGQVPQQQPTYPAQQPQYQQPYPPQQQPPYPPQYAPVAPKKRNNCLIYGIIGAVVVLVICGIIGLVVQQGGKTVITAINTAATSVAGAPTTAPVAAPTAPPYADIAAQKSALTAAQLDPYVKSLAGARIVNWTGTTIDVATKIFSSDVYQIQVDMTGPKDNPLKNPQVYIDITKDQATTIAKGQSITFSGTVDHVDCTLICTVEVNDATYTVK